MWIKKGRQLTGLVAAAVITALVVAACGGADPTAVPPPPPPTQAPVIVVPTATPAPTQEPQVVVQTAAPQATPTPPATQAPVVVVETAAPQEAPTAAPTPTPRIVVQVPTATPVPGLGGVAEVLKGFRWLQGPGLESWRQAPKRGGTHHLRLPQSQQRHGPDPQPLLHRLHGPSSFVYNKLFTCQFSPLMVEADPGSCFPVGDLISEWESNADGSSWTIKIHPDAALAQHAGRFPRLHHGPLRPLRQAGRLRGHRPYRELLAGQAHQARRRGAGNALGAATRPSRGERGGRGRQDPGLQPRRPRPVLHRQLLAVQRARRPARDLQPRRRLQPAHRRLRPLPPRRLRPPGRVGRQRQPRLLQDGRRRRAAALPRPAPGQGARRRPHPLRLHHRSDRQRAERRYQRAVLRAQLRAGLPPVPDHRVLPLLQHLEDPRLQAPPHGELPRPLLRRP